MGEPRSPGASTARLVAFGLDLAPAFTLPGGWGASRGGGEPLSLVEADLAGRGDALAPGWAGVVDGLPFVAEHAASGDVWMRWGDRPLACLRVRERRLEVAAGVGSRPAELRVVMDSVLFTAALALGAEALHAGAVVTPRGALAVCGVSGAGKTSLVAALRAAGHGFLTDDVLVLRPGPEGIAAHPGPPVMNVPAAVAPAAGERLLATLGDERWVAVEGAAEPVPLAGLVLLGDGSEPDWRAPLTHLMRYPDLPARAAVRFDLAVAIASGVPMRSVVARSAPPEQLAAEALDWLAGR